MPYIYLSDSDATQRPTIWKTGQIFPDQPTFNIPVFINTTDGAVQDSYQINTPAPKFFRPKLDSIVVLARFMNITDMRVPIPYTAAKMFKNAPAPLTAGKFRFSSGQLMDQNMQPGIYGQ